MTLIQEILLVLSTSLIVTFYIGFLVYHFYLPYHKKCKDLNNVPEEMNERLPLKPRLNYVYKEELNNSEGRKIQFYIYNDNIKSDRNTLIIDKRESTYLSNIKEIIRDFLQSRNIKCEYFEITHIG